MTYAQLVQALQDETQSNEATFVTNIPYFVQQAEQLIYTSVQLPVLRTNVTSTLTISNRLFPFPTGFLAPYALGCSSAGVMRWLQFKDAEWMREAYPDAVTTAQPKYYAIYDSTQFIVAPLPDAAYPTECHYYKMPTSIVTASTTWLGDNYDNVLFFGALVFAAAFLKLEKDLVELYDAKFKEGLSLLKKLGDGMDRGDTFQNAQTKIAVK